MITEELEDQIKALLEAWRTDANPTIPIDLLEVVAYTLNQISIMRTILNDHHARLNGVTRDFITARLKFTPSGVDIHESA